MKRMPTWLNRCLFISLAKSLAKTVSNIQLLIISAMLITIDYPEATSAPRFMTIRSEMSLSVSSK